MSIPTRILATLALALCIAPTSGAEQTGEQPSAPKRTEALKLAPGYVDAEREMAATRKLVVQTHDDLGV